MDLNSLITTIISSTAALVAIIGGFLVSRVIALSSEQSGIKRKIREVDNDLLAKKELLHNVENYLLEENAYDFLRENIKKILKNRSLPEIINDDIHNYGSEEELKLYYDEMKNIIDELYRLFDRLDEDFEDFDEFFGNNKHLLDDINKKDMYEIAYEGMMDLIDSQSYDQFGLPNFAYAPVAKPPIVNLEYIDKEKERDRLNDDIRVLELQKEEQMKILADYGKPRWVLSGLAVLIYASIVGIIYPSTLLPYPEGTYNDSLTKWFILSLFFSQLLALFIYLGIAMYKLTSSEKE